MLISNDIPPPRPNIIDEISSPPDMLLTRAAIVFVFVSSFVLLSRGPLISRVSCWGRKKVYFVPTCACKFPSSQECPYPSEFLYRPVDAVSNRRSTLTFHRPSTSCASYQACFLIFDALPAERDGAVVVARCASPSCFHIHNKRQQMGRPTSAGHAKKR